MESLLPFVALTLLTLILLPCAGRRCRRPFVTAR
jgi:hypothetical protein